MSFDAFDTRGDGTLRDYARAVVVTWTRPVLEDRAPASVKDAVTCPVCMDPCTDAILHCVHGHTLCTDCSVRCERRPRKRSPHASWADDPYGSDDNEEEEAFGVCPLCRGLPLVESHGDGVRVPNVAVRSLAREWSRLECLDCGERGPSWDVPPKPCVGVCKSLEFEYLALRAGVARKRAERLKTELDRAVAGRSAELTRALESLEVGMTQRRGARAWVRESMMAAFHAAGEETGSFAERLAAKTAAAAAVDLEKAVKLHMASKLFFGAKLVIV